MKQKILSNLIIFQIILLTIVLVIGCNQTNKIRDGMDATNWKIYHSEKYGFEFKYQQDWSLQTSSNDTLLSGEYLFELSNCRNIEVVSDCSILSFVGNDNYTYDKDGTKLYAQDLETKKIGNYNWKLLKYEINGITGITYFIKLPSEESYLRFLYQERYSKKQSHNMDDKILSTFKFIEQK